MQKNTRWFSGALAAVFMAGTLATPIAAKASEEGRRNTAIGLGALTGYLFTRGGSKVPAFIGAGATAYAYKKYNDKFLERKRRERQAAYNRGIRVAKARAAARARAHRTRTSTRRR